MLNKPENLLLLQSVGIMLQMVNAQLATVVKSPVVTLLFGSVVAGFQFYVQHAGNNLPTATPAQNVIVDPQGNKPKE